MEALPLDLSEAWIWDQEEDGLLVLRPVAQSRQIENLEEHVLSFFRVIEWRIHQTDDPAKHVGDVVQDLTRCGYASDALTVHSCQSHPAGIAVAWLQSLTPAYWYDMRPSYESFLDYPLTMRRASPSEIEEFKTYGPMDFLNLQGFCECLLREDQAWAKAEAALGRYLAPFEGERYPDGPVREIPLRPFRCGTPKMIELGDKEFWKRFYNGEL